MDLLELKPLSLYYACIWAAIYEKHSSKVLKSTSKLKMNINVCREYS